MWTVMKKATLLGAGFLLLTGGTARAGVVNVKVPFPFVVQGHVLPAGHYQVDREDTDPLVVLIRGENGNNVARYVLTNPAAGHDPAGDVPALTFKRYEGQYRLTDVWESANQGREIAWRR